MKRAMTNYWVDMITGMAFLFCAVTGLARLFPEATVSMSSAGQPIILGISTSVWQTVHDWSAAIMVVGVGVHTALHLRWLVAMTGNLVRGRGRERAHVKATPATRPATPAAAPVIAFQTDDAAPPARLETSDDGRREDHGAKHRYTRKGFLAAAGVFCAAALVTSRSLARPTEVVIDAAACTGCRRCVLICPYRVFVMSGTKAFVRNGAACQLCAKCTRRCPTGAITLNP